MSMKEKVFLFFLFLCRSCMASTFSTYRAGVVEYHPVNGSASEVVNKNLEQYLKIISDASLQKVDILVFPEATLNRQWNISQPKTAAIVVPSPNEKIIACGNESYSTILQQLSCAAKIEKMYIVVNVAEIINCTDDSIHNCSDKDHILFNTNVVFDRNGTIISRYRKINLWGETGFTGSQDESLGIFETDFGVKFAHFICFDILFQHPAVTSATKAQNIIFPTMWFSELPSLTAVEIQQAWAYTHNVNLLAAGANRPSVGSTGSGIYSGKLGALKSIMSGEAKTELLIADVPKIPNTNINLDKMSVGSGNMKNEKMDSLYLKKHNLTLYVSELIDENVEKQEHHLSFGNSTCNFKINLKKISKNKVDMHHYSYRAIIYDGIRSFEFKDAGVVECGIIACTGENLTTCGERFPDYSKVEPRFEFTRIEINAIVRKPMFNDTMQTIDSAYYPVTLLSNIMPLQFDEYQYNVMVQDDSDMATIDMVMDNKQSELLMFGIFGRTFYTDHLPLSGGSNNLFDRKLSVVMVISSILLSILCKN